MQHTRGRHIIYINTYIYMYTYLSLSIYIYEKLKMFSKGLEATGNGEFVLLTKPGTN